MPRIATAASADEEASSSRVDDLIQRGRSQGHLSLSDLRTAFEQAGLTPAEARSILRELSEAGVRYRKRNQALAGAQARWHRNREWRSHGRASYSSCESGFVGTVKAVIAHGWDGGPTLGQGAIV